MKRILLSLFIILLSISSLVLLQSCEQQQLYPDCEGLNHPPEYYKLSEGQKAILPYTGYDTISMVSNMGDTIHCIGTGKQYFYTMEFKESGTPLCASYGTQLYYEAYKIEFIDSVKSAKIELAQYYKHIFYDKNVNGHVNTRVDDVAVEFKGGGFFVFDDHISNTKVQNYFGDVSVQGILYRNTNKTGNYNSLADSLSFMLINRSTGILKLQLNNTEIWELLPN